MKFYIAARTAKADDVKRIAALLLDLGHEVSHDWTNENTSLPRPYDPKTASEIAHKDLEGVRNAEVFILLGDSQGTGMYVEMGAALAWGSTIFVIGPHHDTTVFHFHPKVRRVESIDDVLQELQLTGR